MSLVIKCLMKIGEVKKLEKYADYVNQTFNSGYAKINQALHWFSILGHVGVVLVGYIYIQQLLLDVKSTIPVWAATGIAGIFLIIFEFLKREVIARFATEHVNQRFALSPGVLSLLGTSLLVMGFSFYVTFSGANKFSNKSEEIITDKENLTQVITDSLTEKYDELKEEQVQKWEGKAEQYYASKKELQDNVKSREDKNVRHARRMQWSEADRIAYDNNIAANQRDLEEIDRLNQKIEEYEARRDTSVAKLERELKGIIAAKLNKLDDKFSRTSDKNENNYLAFIIISILLEAVIMFGIYFNHYYQIRSGREYDLLRSSDPRLQRYLKWQKVLAVIYDKNVTPAMDQALPSAADLEVLLDSRGVNIKQQELNTEFFKMLSSLNIIETRGNKRYLKKQYEDALNAINSQFEI